MDAVGIALQPGGFVFRIVGIAGVARDKSLACPDLPRNVRVEK
ncbi:hypothetical protein GGR33_000885 [Methylobacterium brachythecii]|uniref:Uncharacterized protein n=1 Tax=Methylobacterium brachythecii TaxID=1176177 RepID=A0A7W6F5L7_9HYPH|nr:hypothetical protein [Methylobacterium brachythecii]